MQYGGVAMRSLVFLLAGLLATAAWIHGEIKTPKNPPIEITSTGQTTYENGLVTARDNVAITSETRTFTPITHRTIRPRTTWNRGVTSEFIAM